MPATAFDLSQAIGLAKASHLMRGKGGARLSIETVRRWANPKCGCRPAGKHGPVIFLRTFKVNGEILTMPEWVSEFEAERARLGERRTV